MNTETIRGLSTNLATIHRSLTSADADTNGLAGMIPHDRLADVVREFADKWDRRRTELTEHVEILRDKARMTADAFEDVDGALADTAEGKD